MALKDGARIKETTQTQGTGALALDGAAIGYNSFLDEIGENNTAFYWLFDANKQAWECGIATVLPNSLTRAVIYSTNNNNAIPLSVGTHTVINAPVNGYATGGMNFQDLLLQRPEICDYSETIATPSISSGVLTLDLETANVFSVVHNQNITSLVVTNPPASGKAGSFTLHLTQDATGGRTISFSSAFGYGSTTAPTIATTANKRNKFVFDTINGGTKWDIGYCGLF